jgi:hypothetical protein
MVEYKLKRQKAIPKSFIYEIIDGKPFYYRGFKEVLAKKRTFEEVV